MSAGEYEQAWGSTNECGRVRTSEGGMNTAGAAAGAMCPLSLIPLPLPPFLFLFLHYYLDIFIYFMYIMYLQYFNAK